MPARLFVIAEIRVYCETLAWRLSLDGFATIVGTATAARGALRSIAELRPEIVLIDVVPSQPFSDVRCLAAVSPGERVVALAVPQRHVDVVTCAEDGIIGYIPGDATFPELLATLRDVQAGEGQCPPRIAAGLRHRLAERGSPPAPSQLTPRETEILALIDQGLSNQELAWCLHIELATVKNHVHRILEKLHAHRRGEAAALAAGRVPHSFICSGP
jgi:two-component system nitrate/nitrite response regulator NarL